MIQILCVIFPRSDAQHFVAKIKCETYKNTHTRSAIDWVEQTHIRKCGRSAQIKFRLHTHTPHTICCSLSFLLTSLALTRFAPAHSLQCQSFVGVRREFDGENGIKQLLLSTLNDDGILITHQQNISRKIHRSTPTTGLENHLFWSLWGAATTTTTTTKRQNWKWIRRRTDRKGESERKSENSDAIDEIEIDVCVLCKRGAIICLLLSRSVQSMLTSTHTHTHTWTQIGEREVNLFRILQRKRGLVSRPIRIYAHHIAECCKSHQVSVCLCVYMSFWFDDKNPYKSKFARKFSCVSRVSFIELIFHFLLLFAPSELSDKIQQKKKKSKTKKNPQISGFFIFGWLLLC